MYKLEEISTYDKSVIAAMEEINLLFVLFNSNPTRG